MRTSAALLASIIALSTAAPAMSKTTNCRKCSPHATITGYFDMADVDGFKRHIEPTITGGDSFSWTMISNGSGAWEGTAVFDRLCGDSKSVDYEWPFYYFKDKQGRPLETKLRLKGDCGKAVRCRGGSKCEKSGIM